jgi:hypothetical protein
VRASWRNYSLSVVLAILFLISWLIQGYFQWVEFVHSASIRGQSSIFSAFVPVFLASTFENWQSEFLQLLTIVILTTYLVHRGLTASNERIESKIDAIVHTVDQLERRR